jgi:hypothetical protein
VLSKSLVRSYRFFLEFAGYCVGFRAQGAFTLAKAERFATDHEWEAVWEWDEDADLSWMSEEERNREHEVLCCLLKDADGNILAALCGITDPDSNYQRVVTAELSLEAMVNSQQLDRVWAD